MENELKVVNVASDKTWFRTKEAAFYLGITENALWILVSRGFLLKRKLHGRLYFKKAELDLLIEKSVKR